MDRMIILLCLGAQLVYGQSVAFSDPERPGFLKLHQSNGSITVTGYSGKTVVIQEQPSHTHRTRTMPRINVNVEGNRMTLKAEPNASISIQVPFQTSLELNDTNGSIHVEGVKGELDVQTTNGSISLRGVAGAVVANSHNGSINVTFDKVDARRPMSFSSFNGKIDVVFPADLKASLNVHVERGSVRSDFDLLMRGGTAGKSFTATINGGGTEMQFKNYNGSVNIRKASAGNK